MVITMSWINRKALLYSAISGHGMDGQVPLKWDMIYTGHLDNTAE